MGQIFNKVKKWSTQENAQEKLLIHEITKNIIYQREVMVNRKIKDEILFRATESFYPIN